MIDRILEKAMRTARGAEVVLSENESTPVSFENDRLKSIKVDQTTNISLRVIVDGKVGSSRTTDVEDVEGLVERAIETARFGSTAHFEFPAPQEAPEVKIYDGSIPELSREQMVDIGEEMLDLLKGYDPEILVGCGVTKSVGRSHFLNSSGLEFTSRGTSFSVYVGGELIRDTDILHAWDGQSWRRFEIDHVEVTKRAVEKFRLAERIAEIKSGEMPVIFTPRGVIVLLFPLELGLSGRNVLKGDSPLAGKLGERICDSQISITDNPLIDYAPSSSRYDGEGVPHQITPLIEDGVLGSFLYDLDTAGRAGTKSTGNGPGCGPSNVIVREGDVSCQKMIKNIREGILVDNVMGLGQSNIINGDFSVNVSLGYKIEDGQIVGRVKDVMLAGNSYDALRNVVAIGDKAEWTSGWGASLKVPPIQIARLSVVSKE